MLTKTPNGRTATGSAPFAPPKKRRRRLGPWIAVLILVILAAAAATVFLLRPRAKETYVTNPVTVQDLTQTVTASGTVNAQNTVLVGTQVSGTIQSIYVDYNSRVREGQVLARLDPSQFQAQLAQNQSGLMQTRAQAGAAWQNAVAARFSTNASSAAVLSAGANVAKARSTLLLAQQTLARDKTLLAQGFIPQSQYDADYANFVAEQTGLRAAAAAVTQSTAQTLQSSSSALGSASSADAAAAAVEASKAAVEQAQLNLSRTVITSPVDGTVVARNVSVGQTVAASFQTPTLFTIAQDLKKMEVDISVGESDIGNIRRGDGVTFSVLAYPTQIFDGIVSQVRVNPTTVSNVVTYTVIVLVDNAGGKLLPGMTANANIAVARASHALVVPAQALSYRPKAGANGARPALRNGLSPWGQVASGTAGAVVAGTRRSVFVLRDGKPQAISVKVDLVSGMQAAVTPLRGSLKAGDEVIVGDSSTRSQRSAANSSPAGLGRVIH
ncbi:MAG TPA: efflux RND transporter periplasmic adaptor subunit [Candidatus Baltobacteraceae bacterium]|nr:efflux RND transporter periplasmic adaptor subunit [Candidatus Baltobacteraceae bacterium]